MWTKLISCKCLAKLLTFLTKGPQHMWCGRCAGHSGACLPRIPRCPFAVANLYTWKHECVIWVCYWIQTNGSISITLNGFWKKKHFNFKFRDWLPAPALCSLWGAQCFDSFQFQVFVEQNLPSVYGKSYSGYKLFITLDNKTKVVPVGSLSQGELAHKIGHPTWRHSSDKFTNKNRVSPEPCGTSWMDTPLDHLKIYVFFHISGPAGWSQKFARSAKALTMRPSRLPCTSIILHNIFRSKKNWRKENQCSLPC